MTFAGIPLPVERSRTKPRQRGRTMMMDWGVPLGAQGDWLGLVGPFVDLAKLVVGTARLYEEPYLRRKLELYAEHDVEPFIGGQFLEYVYAIQGMAGVAPFCDEAVRLGVRAVEVSDNVVSIDTAERNAIIATALGAGLEVHGEVGSKTEGSGAAALVADAESCFEAGAAVVLVEAAELVHGGEPRADIIEALRSELDVARVMFELPGPWIRGTTLSDLYELKKMLVATLGPDVNLANVMPDQVFETEALRCGLSVPGPPG